MKVIGTSNFAIESIADFVVEAGLEQEAAEKLAEEKNAESGENGTYYYKVVLDDHKLWGGMAELI